ncbi:MAG: type II toxin-antitoxin system VapC family toxin [Pirellulales bacterium]|nr:type II toxin-antitoxin system VapC family toxin [Pirellulales bacterium]
MSGVFADSYYFFALLNPRDQAHAKAVAFSQRPASLVTTAWVLTELGDGLAHIASRAAFAKFVARFASRPTNRIIPPTQVLFERGVALYDARRDKSWSLTDCISFVVIREEGITMALTADHHFEQAGFIACLK